SDGGYYLLGMNRPWDIFNGIRWSTRWALEDTVHAAEKLGLKVSFLRTLRDVDTEEDLHYLYSLGIRM
ncbi:MAG: hypothetical protein D6778_07430, partial [Nitrospirae bacterium]